MPVYDGVAPDKWNNLGIAAGVEAGATALKAMMGKATLYVRLRDVDFMDTTGSSTNEDVMGLRSLIKKRDKNSSKLAKRAGSVTSSTALAMNAMMNSMSKAELTAAALSKGFIPMEVQYNPSSLRMNTIAGKIRSYTAMGAENMNRYSTTERKASTTLMVQLIFDKTNISDAFGATSLGSSVDVAWDMAKDMGTNLFGEGYSVKKEVEGLISLLMDKYTRQVIFVWNDMFFHGELNMISANFTMFNKIGNPIRATVDLHIKQSDTNASFMSDREYWDDALDRAST